jgi:thioesterase domain-containing protein
VVVVREDRPGQKVLAAYLVAESGSGLDPEKLRAGLKSALPDYMIPNAFVFLDAIPLTATNKVDRKALPAPERQASTYLAPATAMEQTVAKVWQDILGLERVGAGDNFFELGGHSLLGIQLMARLGQTLHLDLPHRLVLDAPVLADMAANIQGRLIPNGFASQSKENSLLALNTQIQGRPLFCIHPMDGSATCYKALAMELQKTCPVYGIESPVRLGLVKPFETAEAMAADYLQLIQAKQPHGPYRLLAWSFGGVIAHEMARQLALLGESVDWVCLLDSVAPVAVNNNYPRQEAGYLSMANTFEKMMPEEHRRSQHMLHSGEDALLQYTVDILRQGAEFKDVKRSDIEKFLEIYLSHLNIMLRYRPARLAYDICLIRAENESENAYNYAAGLEECLRVENLARNFREGKITVETYMEKRDAYQPELGSGDEQLGWGDLTARAVNVFFATGDHAQMVLKPHVEKTAGLLKTYLEQRMLESGSVENGKGIA